MSDLWIGLRTGPARAGLAFFSLALGLFAVTILLSTLDALRHQAQDLVRSFGAGSFALVPSAAPTERNAWSRRQVQFFRENLGADAWVSGVKSLGTPTGTEEAVATTDAQLGRVRGWRFSQGRALDEVDVRQGARHAMASSTVCAEHRWKVGAVILLGNEPFRLVGSFESGGEPIPGMSSASIFIPYSADGMEMGDEQSLRRVDALLFRARGEGEPEELRRRVQALLMQPGLGTDGVDWITPESLLQGIRRWQRAIAWTAGSGGALSLLLGAMTLAGMLLTGVRERIPEIGLRRALGARQRNIASLFVVESLALSGAAAVVGMLAAEIVLRWLGSRFPLPFHFGMSARILPLVLTSGIAILCSIGPAWLAARLPPAEALRNE